MDIDKAFDKVSDVIEADLPIDKAMKSLIDYCEKTSPSTAWAAIRNINFAVDAEGIAVWLKDLLATDPIPANIKAYWFGLFETEIDDEPAYSLYISGSPKEYDEDDSDWAVFQPDSYLPEDRYASSPALAALEQALKKDDKITLLGEYCLVLGYGALAVQYAITKLNLSNSTFAVPKKPRPVIVGFDEGDYLGLGEITPKGWA